ncbi:uncharacterized protein LOC119667019 [Teleopsis dalmanni]|uniref:uncharacterized protein LOC119667019 n=1 Tax=Teleopsis dalmanni TaxID=139649 RepID=UPI0018CCF04D|nr:uncharacterized protein LOC119667019 [Teleopsis dalmanni]
MKSLLILITQLYILLCLFRVNFCWKFSILPNSHAELGEGPHWRYPNLYYADFATGNLYRHETTTKRTFKCKIKNENRSSIIIPYRNTKDLFVVGLNQKVAQVKWDGRSAECHIIKVLFKIHPNDEHVWLNDGKCDANGALFIGSAKCGLFPNQNLYKYKAGTREIIKRNINISNGFAWNHKRNEMYHVDSAANTITKFKLDHKGNILGSPKIVFEYNESIETCEVSDLAVMDGMTIDTEGFLYVAIFGGKKVIKICTRKWDIVKTFDMPCAAVSSVSFGGPNMDVLYVTSAASLFDIASYPKPCGSVFSFNVGAKGLSPDECSLALPLKITTLENTHAELADGPHWRHPNLYYADLGTGNLFRRDTTTNQTFKCKINKENRASFIIPYRNSNDLFVVGLNKKVAQIKWDGRSSQCCIVKVLFQIKSDDAHAFINDGKCAANGALFTGSASCNFTQFDEKLYKYRSGFPEIIKKNISYSNGLVWNNRRNELYQVDSKENTIMQYTFDQKNDLLGKPKVVFKFNNTVESCESSDLVVMDGMTTDSKGHLYVAIFGAQLYIFLCFLQMRVSGLLSIHIGYNENPKITILENTLVDHGEGPHWQFPNLFYTDMANGLLCRHDTLLYRTYCCKINGYDIATFIIPYKYWRNCYVVGMGNQVNKVEWNGISSECFIVEQLYYINTTDSNRFFNDGKCNHKGYLYTGSAYPVFEQAQEKLYSLRNNISDLLRTNLASSNGMAWNYNQGKFYHIDSGNNTITQFTYDNRGNVLANPSIVFELNEPKPIALSRDTKLLDGMTIDIDGNLWVAIFNTPRVIKIDPNTGAIMREFILPCGSVTSVTFGGFLLDSLYVTTSRSIFGFVNPAPCGAVFRISNIRERGYEAYKFIG